MLHEGKFLNVFRKTGSRGRQAEKEVEFCKECSLCTPGPPSPSRVQQCLSERDRRQTLCQPKVQHDYVPLAGERRKSVLSEKSLSIGRLKHWPVTNVLRTQETDMWNDKFRTSQKSAFYQ